MILICTAKAKYLQLKVNVDNGKEFNTLPYIEKKNSTTFTRFVVYFG